MTRQEKIRKGIALQYLQWKENDTTLQLKDIHDFFRSECFDFADEIMKQEASQGVVIKVDRALPLVYPEDNGHMIQNDMLRAGYVAVESLIKE